MTCSKGNVTDKKSDLIPVDMVKHKKKADFFLSFKLLLSHCILIDVDVDLVL